MADIKISDMTPKASAMVTTDEIEINEGGFTKSVTGQNIIDMIGADNLNSITTPATARTNLALGTLAVADNIDNSDWSGVPLSIANGGTNSTTASGARSALGLGSLALANNINNTNWSGAALSVPNGGTGATTTSAARAALGLAIGSDVQAHNTILDNTTASFTAADEAKLDGISSGANNYVHPTTSGNRHIPSGGVAGNYLKYSSDGTAVWNAITESDENFTTAFKAKLEGIESSANNYAHPTTAGNKHVPSGGLSGQLLKSDGVSGEANWWTHNFATTTHNHDADYADIAHTHSNYCTANASDTLTGIYTFSNGNASTSTTTGVLRVTGGIGLTGAINAGGNISAFASSDARLKHDIKPISNALEKVHMISGNSFIYDVPETEADQGIQYGVVAQEIQHVLPEMVTTDDSGYLRVRQAGFELTALLIEAVKELSLQVGELEARV